MSGARSDSSLPTSTPRRALINASDVTRLPQSHANVSATSAIEVLASIGLLNDDRLTPERRYFNDRMSHLPTQMRNEVDVWFDVMIHGSTTSPRRRPRDPATARLHIRALAPVLRIWASQGHDSLTSIEPRHILDVLPPTGTRRHTIEQGLRSLFKILKSRRLVFINPLAGLPSAQPNTTIPLPIDTTTVRQALDSTRPATALCAALVVFHGLTVDELRSLKLTDIVDGQLHLNGRVIPLVGPVLPRLAAWLDDRTTRWPDTINPHLLISLKTGPRLTRVSRSYPQGPTGIALQALREDRILDEVRATGGDVRHRPITSCTRRPCQRPTATHTATVIGGSTISHGSHPTRPSHIAPSTTAPAATSPGGNAPNSPVRRRRGNRYRRRSSSRSAIPSLPSCDYPSWSVVAAAPPACAAVC